MPRFLDTDICIAFLRGTSIAVRDRLLRLSRNEVALPAIVVAEKGILVTGNVREFNRVPGLKLENWLRA